MRRPFVILLIVITNLCQLLDSYKITSDRSSKTVQDSNQQDSANLHEEYVEENYSDGDSYKQESIGRVVIGKWRNNGEAFEPKWRDGDSVPLAPFSTISFKSGWRRDPNSQEEDYQIEPDSFNENGKKHLGVSLADQEFEATEPEENRESYHRDVDRKVGRKNTHRKDREFDETDTDYEGRIHDVQKHSSTFNGNGNIQGSTKYRETLPNYPNEYELFENENDNPRPRKRRPPEHYEFPGSWNPDINRREESHDDKHRVIEQNQSPSMASDVRRYLLSDKNPGSANQTKSQENAELKTFLKMQGESLSLSEILQQKNLTLADLLKGKPSAIKILKSNERRVESQREEDTSTESVDRSSPDSTSEYPSWTTPRRTMIRKFNQNTNFANENNSRVLNFGETTLYFETTTVATTSKNTEGTTDYSTSSFDTGKLSKDDKTVSSEKSEHIKPLDVEKSKSDSEEFLKPLENRESLLTGATTAVEDGAAKYSTEPVGTSTPRFIPEHNNDEDEIMEFSDYPAAKMPKFVTPMLHKVATLNTKRKNISFSAIGSTLKPGEDPELKLSIEDILSPENKVSTVINNTDEDPRKIVNVKDVKNMDVMNAKREDEVYEKVRNETVELKLQEKTETKSKSMEYKNPVKSNESKNENEKEAGEKYSEKISTKNIKDDFGQNPKESTTRSYGYETLPQEQKDLSFNHKLHEILIPKIDPQSRAEILELFSSGSSAERLERLLTSRNMTIAELIALRQRGSSQVHFAEVFKAREHASVSLPQNYKTEFQDPENYKEVEKSRTSKTVEKIGQLEKNNNSSDIEDIKNLKSAGNITENKKEETFQKVEKDLGKDLLNRLFENKNVRKDVTLNKVSHNSDTPDENPDIKSRAEMELGKSIRNSDLSSMLAEFPAGNNIQRDSEGSSYYTSIEAVKLPVEGDVKKKIPDTHEVAEIAVLKSVTAEEIGRVEEIMENDLKSIKNVYRINDYDFSEKKALSKVKPSIIASGGILGVTIVVFLSIFIACRIQQKKKFAYKNSFTKAVFHNPVMTARKLSNTSSINTIMVDVVATSTTKRPQKRDIYESDDFEQKSDIDNDSLDANDSWDTIPDFMK